MSFSGNNLSPQKDFTVVIPVYFNEGVLPITMEALNLEVLERNKNLTCEIIFVDDGSEDDSFNTLLKLREQYPEIVKIVKLTRNFGQVNAIMAGLSLASGKCTVIMSADNQDPAELVNQMLASFFDDHIDIVICSRKGRDETLLRKWTSHIFYSSMKKISFANMPQGGFDYVLLSRRAAKVILRNQEASPFFQGQILWTGFKTRFIEYHRRKREVGTSKWTLGKRLTYLIDGVMSYSFIPIRLMSAIGILVALLGFVYAAIVFFIRITWGLPVAGFAPLMIVILVIGGLQMIMLGIIGEYLWRVLAQARNRDPYIIESTYGEFTPASDSQIVS